MQLKPMIKSTLVGLALLSSSALTYATQTNGLAITQIEQSQETIKAASIEDAQEKLKQTFTQLNFTDFGPAPIPGLFQLIAGPNVFYFHPETETLFIGNIYNKDGESLTEKTKQEHALKVMSTLPMDKGIELGDKEGPTIIEFGQMDCHFCMSAEEYFAQLHKKYHFKRQYFLLDVGSQFYPTARKKAEHLVCSDDKNAALADIVADRVKQYKTCPEAEELLKTHADINNKFGISGTPTFLINNKLYPGLNQNAKDAIETYLGEQNARIKL